VTVPKIARTLILVVATAVFVGPVVLALGHLAHAAWGMALLNSLTIAICFTVLSTASAALAGFAFARHRVWWKNVLFLFVLSTLMVPWIVTMIPQFVIFYRLHLINTPWPWVLWGIQGTPLQIFLFRQFYASFPRELEEPQSTAAGGYASSGTSSSRIRSRSSPSPQCGRSSWSGATTSLRISSSCSIRTARC
jgi:ABC-type Fe3+ transport system permease subunit